MAKAYSPYSSPKESKYLTQLRKETAAVKFSHTKFGVRKSLTTDQVREAAAPFGADQEFVSASKRLLWTKDDAYQLVLQTINKARAFWTHMTVPYPVEGTRLIRRELVPTFDAAMTDFETELSEAEEKLEEKYQQLRTEARDRLGSLFNEADYPASLAGEFTIDWEYPSVEPPDWLKQLNPQLWKQEQARIAARFAEAAALAEQAFAGDLQQLVSHLLERLSGTGDGKKKIFRDSAIENMTEFFQRFKTMRITDDSALDKLVDQAERALGGVDPADLRNDETLRTRTANALKSVAEKLDTMLVEKPTRAIELEDEEEAPAAEGGTA